jgi:hypothetical protein
MCRSAIVRDRLLLKVPQLILNTKGKSTVEAPNESFCQMF